MFETIKEFIASQEKEALKLLETIVNMDSGSKDKAEVDNLGKLLLEQWKELGGEIEIEELRFDEVGNCYIARFNKESKNKKVVLMGHFDTVFPKGTVDARPFRIEGKRAYGPGVGDMKGGLITMLFAVKALKSQGRLSGPLSVILNSHEEIGSAYLKDYMVSEARDSHIAFNLEFARPDGSLVTGRKGVANLNILIEGKAAHSGVEPEKGANANVELAHRILELQELNNCRQGLTINVNVISGGFASNVISDKAKAEVDIRFINVEDIDYIKQYILNSFSKPKVVGTKCSSDIEVSFVPMERNDKVLSVYNLVKKAGEELGINIGEAFAGGGADSGFISQEGIPTICGMGPVAGKGHSVDEYLEIPTITERCKLLAIAIDMFWKESD